MTTVNGYEIKPFANLSRANLSEADLSEAILNGADLSGAILSGAILSRADLSRADLSDAILNGADLSEAILSRADLSRADLSEANLSRADLSEAILSEAILNVAILSGAILPTGHTWEEWLDTVVPAYLTAGGKALTDAPLDVWRCHTWHNCPTAWAFDVHSVEDIPILLRPVGRLFIALWDGHAFRAIIEDRVVKFVGTYEEDEPSNA